MSFNQNYMKNIVNKNQTRIYSGLVVLLMSSYLFTSNEIFIYVLIYDFFAMIYILPQISPIYLISTYLVKIIKLEIRSTDGSAKIFAFHVGLTLLIVALIADLANENKTAFLIVVFLIVWKLADVAREFCLACKFYEFLKSKNIEVESL